MILKWSKFNESENQELITRDMIKEVLSFRWYSVNIQSDILLNIGKIELILPEIGLSIELEEDNIDKIYKEVKGKLEEDGIYYKLRETLIQLFQLISVAMEGFPRFYEMEDCLLSYLDEGYGIEYEFRDQSMNIFIKNYINIPEYAKLLTNSIHIINRLKNFTKKEIFVSDSEYINKGESQLKITIQ